MKAVPAGDRLALRIVVLKPVAGVALAVQDRNGGLLQPAGHAPRSVWFDFEVRVNDAATALDFLGEYVQGPRGGRFVYVNAGVRAGQALSPWDRRAKVPLGAIPASLVALARGKPAVMLAAAIAGTNEQGGPACATVPLASEWRIIRKGPRHGVARP